MPDETGVSVVLQRGAVVSPQGVMMMMMTGMMMMVMMTMMMMMVADDRVWSHDVPVAGRRVRQ
jgi:hypothetical protein